MKRKEIVVKQDKTKNIIEGVYEPQLANIMIKFLNPEGRAIKSDEIVKAQIGSLYDKDRLDEIVTTGTVEPHDVKYYIRKGMKQFIFGVNQPAGNRSFNSPFSNISYYDSVYFNSLFEFFYYPDGTQPE